MSPSALSLLQVGGALLVVLLAATASLTLLKRLSSGRLGRNVTGLQPVATLPLGQQRFLMVVQVGGEGILVGVTPQSVNLVARGVALNEPVARAVSESDEPQAVVADQA